MTSTVVAPSEHLALPGRPQSVGHARRFVAERLVGQGLSEDMTDTAVLLVSEVVTNAVVHAATDVVVRLGTSYGRGVLVHVVDDSPLPLARRERDLDAVAGRGLAMIELLAACYGAAPVPGGKVVWFALGDTADLAVPGRTGWSWPTVGLPPTHTVDVRLHQLPIGLCAIVLQHDEALLREYQLRLLAAEQHAPATDERDTSPDLPRAGVAALARALSGLAAAIRTAARAAGQEPVDSMARLDITLSVSDDDVAAYELLPVVLDQAEALSAQGAFLTSPAIPEMLSLRNWLCSDIVAQARGGAPTRWTVGDALLRALPASSVDVDLDWVAATDQSVVVSDEANCILAVSDAAASMLGWDGCELVGRRLTTIVPLRLREAHVTGFASHVHTGRTRIMGSVRPLAALCRDGDEVRVRLRIEPMRQGARTLYIGWLNQTR